MATTLKDIAKSLNLSISTVSAALQNRADISLETRRKVQEKVRELNYHPNTLARSLVTQRSHTIGVVVPDLSRSFFAEVTRGIDQQISEANFNLLLSNTGEDWSREDRSLDTLISQRVEGLIIASSHAPGSTAFLDHLASAAVPLVLIDRKFPKANFVGGDDQRIGLMATQHLLAQGYRQVAHISGPQNISTAIGRKAGYVKALRKAGMDPTDSYIVEAAYHEESSGFDAMNQLLRSPHPPDAVFAASDPIAIGAQEAIFQAGLMPGPDIGIVGVGNHRYGAYLRVALSTIDQRRNLIGETAAKLLLDLIRKDNRSAPKTIVIEPVLITRSSSIRNPETTATISNRPTPAAVSGHRRRSTQRAESRSK